MTDVAGDSQAPATLGEHEDEILVDEVRAQEGSLIDAPDEGIGDDGAGSPDALAVASQACSLPGISPNSSLSDAFLNKLRCFRLPNIASIMRPVLSSLTAERHAYDEPSLPVEFDDLGDETENGDEQAAHVDIIGHHCTTTLARYASIGLALERFAIILRELESRGGDNVAIDQNIGRLCQAICLHCKPRPRVRR